MNRQKEQQLKAKRKDSDITPSTYPILTNTVFKNAEQTSDEDAAVGSTWKEYWQIYALDDFPTICPFCGEPLNKDEVDGCHIQIKSLIGDGWLKKTFIIPGHHSCNSKFGRVFSSKISIKAIEAIKKE